MTKQPKEKSMPKSKKVEQVNNDVGVVERVRPKKDDKGRYVEVDMSMEEIEAAQRSLGITKINKSSTIRYLASQEYSPSAIAKCLNIIYQHVRNVLNQHIKRPTTPAVQEEPVTEEEGNDEDAG